jgi:hypothetical protein
VPILFHPLSFILQASLVRLAPDDISKVNQEYRGTKVFVVQLVPHLPPAIDGVGDYALSLAHQLQKDFGIETHFIVGNPNWQGGGEIEGFRVSKVMEYSATAVLSLLPSDRAAVLLLHYSGYGYAQRGCPVWLVDGLQRWHEADINRFLVTMFHEIYAFGPPWTSSFWLSPMQRYLAVRLAKLSDHILTSTQDYAKTLQEFRLGKHSPIPTLPVFSSIGEPAQVLPLHQRDRRLVVFGSSTNRLRVYLKSLAELEFTCQLLAIEEIWDVGSPTGLTLPTVNGVPIVELGKRSATEISGFLLNSLAGFFDYPCKHLAKSTIFATYCAHGPLPISARRSPLALDGIEAGKHFWIPASQTTELKELEQLQAIAENAFAWYQTHNLSAQAKVFATYLDKR